MVEFSNDLSSLVRSTKHNVLLISGDFNAKPGSYSNNNQKIISFHRKTNINGSIMFLEFATENELNIVNTKFLKRHGKLWTFEYANGYKAQLDYILINKKWKNHRPFDHFTRSQNCLLQTPEPKSQQKE